MKKPTRFVTGDRIIALILSGVLLFFLLSSGLLPALLPLIWHYLLCGVELLLCLYALRTGRRGLGLLLSFLTLFTAMPGFALVFLGPFLSSGKTLAMYLNRYAPFSLSVFLFPLAGILLSLRQQFVRI